MSSYLVGMIVGTLMMLPEEGPMWPPRIPRALAVIAGTAILVALLGEP